MAGGVAIMHGPCGGGLIKRGEIILRAFVHHETHRAIVLRHEFARPVQPIARIALGQYRGNLRQFIAGPGAGKGFLLTFAQAGGKAAGDQRDNDQHQHRNRMVRPMDMKTEIRRQEEEIIRPRPGQRGHQPRPQPSRAAPSSTGKRKSRAALASPHWSSIALVIHVTSAMPSKGTA
jgi:hypothetical protein